MTVPRTRLNQQALAEGASDAVYSWLAEHPISAQEPFFDAVDKAVTRWLESNGDEIVAAIAHSAEARIPALIEDRHDPWPGGRT